MFEQEDSRTIWEWFPEKVYCHMQENDLYTKIAQLPRSASLRKVNVGTSVVKEA